MDKQKNVKAFLFDLDGTLVDLPIDYKRMRERLKKLFIGYKITSEFKPLVPSIDDCLSKLKKEDITDREIEKLRKCAYEIIDDEELLSVESSHLILGSKEILTFAKKRKIKIVIFTRNSSKCVNAVFTKNKLPKPDLIASRDKVEKLKPANEHINYILTQLRIKTDECLIIGDSFHDALAGEKQNIKTIILRKLYGI